MRTNQSTNHRHHRRRAGAAIIATTVAVAVLAWVGWADLVRHVANEAPAVQETQERLDAAEGELAAAWREIQELRATVAALQGHLDDDEEDAQP
jgi:hypothetical protein